MDRLTELPRPLIEKILLSMPTLDAVRTSVLSKAWQYKWTKLPKMVLDVPFFLRARSIREYREAPFDYVHIVYSLLVQHSGHLEEFHLVIPDVEYPKTYYFNQVIRTVLLRGIEKITITKWGAEPHTWPSSFPTSASLAYLELYFCKLKQEPFCRGFQNLNSLIFDSIECDPGTLSSCIFNSPNLRKIVLRNLNYEGQLLTICAPMLEYLFVRGKFTSIHLPRAQNLTEMEIHLDFMDEYSAWEMAYMTDLFGSLVRLQSLRMNGNTYKLFPLASHWTMLPRGFGELRVFRLTHVDFCDVVMLRCFLCFIRSSPNLRRLEISACPPRQCRPWEELNLNVPINKHCTLEHLKKVYIGPIIGTKNELDVIEFLLHCSPALQEMALWQAGSPGRDGQARFAESLAPFRRASASVKIDVFYHYREKFFRT